MLSIIESPYWHYKRTVAKVKNEKSRNDVKVGHPGEGDVNPDAAINMDV